MVLNYSLGAEGCVFASCLTGGLERRRAKGPSRGVPGSPATWEGEELSRCRRDAPTRGGGRPRGWGSAQGPRVLLPRVTSLPLFAFFLRHHVGRKRRGRAQRSGRAPTPSFWGAGAYWAKAGTSPHPGPPSLHPLQGPHPRGSQEGTRLR